MCWWDKSMRDWGLCGCLMLYMASFYTFKTAFTQCLAKSLSFFRMAALAINDENTTKLRRSVCAHWSANSMPWRNKKNLNNFLVTSLTSASINIDGGVLFSFSEKRYAVYTLTAFMNCHDIKHTWRHFGSTELSCLFFIMTMDQAMGLESTDYDLEKWLQIWDINISSLMKRLSLRKAFSLVLFSLRY